jgi:hypothetical protein
LLRKEKRGYRTSVTLTDTISIQHYLLEVRIELNYEIIPQLKVTTRMDNLRIPGSEGKDLSTSVKRSDEAQLLKHNFSFTWLVRPAVIIFG